MSIKKKIARNTFANYVGYFWKLGINFFLFPFVVHHLGLAPAGMWFLLTSVTGYFGLLDLGIKPALIKHLSQFKAKKDTKSINEIISTAFALFLILGAIAGIGMAVVGYFAPSLFKVSGELVGPTRTSAYIVAFALFLSFPMSAIGGGVLSGFQRYDLGRSASIFSSGSGALAIVYLLNHNYGLVALVIADQATNVLSWFLTVYYAKKIAPYLTLKLSFMKRKVAKKIFKFSGVIFVTELASQVIYYGDRIVIGIFLGAGPIVFYEAAYKLYRTITRIPLLLVSAVMPAASELHAISDKKSLRKLYLYSTKYTIAFFLMLVVPVIIFAKPILVRWVGPEFSQSAIYVQLFLIYVFFTLNHSAAAPILTGMGKIKLLARYQIIVAIMNLILSVALIRKIGILGVVLGTTIPFVFMEWYYIKMAFDYLKVDWKVYLQKVIILTYIPGLISAVLLFTISRYFQPTRISTILLVFIINFVIYGSLFYKIGLEDWEIKMVKGLIKSKRAIKEVIR